MSDIKAIFGDILQRLPEVKGLILLDIDGIPLEIGGKFDMKPEDLGALLAACYNSYAQVGLELGQSLDMIIVELGDLKLCQSGMPRGLLTIIATKESYLGLIRLEAKRAIEKITRIMRDTQDIRKSLMEQHKIRIPDEQDLRQKMTRQQKVRSLQDQDIDDILAKLRKGLK
ncbi:MAG: hypothetical protein A2Y86_02440 [Candidatus Aminicenantes bacterium RBG_13_62_12]|nr:MAG: hypothetical protein A2Y86_02440 [Candidatus Aminicenantes bacterium RBG_13_62_12]